MKLQLKNKLKNSVQIKLSITTKLLITASFVALFLFIVTFLFYNGGIHKTGKSENCIDNFSGKLTFKINGVNNLASIGTPGLIFTDKLSVSAWIKWDTIPQSENLYATLVSKFSNNFHEFGQFWLQHNSSSQKFEFVVSTTVGKKTVLSVTKPSRNKWYHIIGVYDGSTISLYINGKIEDKKVLTGNLIDYCTFEYFAFEGSSENKEVFQRYCGKIDDVSIWNTNLNEQQIRKVLCNKYELLNKSALLGYWDFNKETDTKYSANSFNSHFKTNFIVCKF